eukprot:7382481-Prymnesium_polylepis.2
MRVGSCSWSTCNTSTATPTGLQLAPASALLGGPRRGVGAPQSGALPRAARAACCAPAYQHCNSNTQVTTDNSEEPETPHPQPTNGFYAASSARAH